jgi:hypothetical protein
LLLTLAQRCLFGRLARGTGYNPVVTCEADISAATIAYCRQARRLRKRFADRPVELHRALKSLNSVQSDQKAAGRAAGGQPEPGFSSAVWRSIPERTPRIPRGQVRRVPFEPEMVCPAVLLGVPPDQESAVRRYVAHARSVISGQAIITGRHRQQLLGVAQRLEIERFHANLVIAALLHEGRDVSFPPVISPITPQFVPSIWLALAATQIAIIAGWAAIWIFLA